MVGSLRRRVAAGEVGPGAGSTRDHALVEHNPILRPSKTKRGRQIRFRNQSRIRSPHFPEDALPLSSASMWRRRFTAFVPFVQIARRTRGELGTQPHRRLGRDLNPLVLSDFTDNPNSTARRNGHSDGNRTHISLAEPRCSLAVEPRSDQMDKGRDRTEALHAGNRTRTAKACATDGTPS